jgi:two-component sensor histidine kinase
MGWRDDFDLPTRFARILPTWVTEIIVAAAMVTAAIGARLIIDLAFENVAEFALMFPAVVGAVLLAGPRAGALVILVGQLLAWYFVVPIKGSFLFATPGNAVSLILATLAELLLLWSLSSYRQAVREGAAADADRNTQLQATLVVMQRQTEIDRQLRDHETSLREARQKLVAIYDSSADGLTLCRAIRDTGGRIVDYQVIELNKGHGELTGVPRDVMLGKPVSHIAPPVDQRWFDSADQAIRTGEMQQFDVYSSISHRWLNIRVSPVSADLFQQTFIDVTDRHRLDDQRDALLKEMSHRVMNNFQMMASFLHIQSVDADPSAREMLRVAEGRLQVLAKLHSLLAYTESDREIDARAYITQLCEQLAAVVDRPGDITIDCRCEPVIMTTDKMVPLGFVISELVTNAAKYAYPPPAGGVISVSLSPVGDQWKLTVRDNGQGLPPSDSRPASGLSEGGLGSRLVRVFVQQIGGVLTSTANPGLRHDITFTP